jgi:plasmid stability protein
LPAPRHDDIVDITMGQILIRNLDDAVIDRLKARARRNRTSAEEEARRALAAETGAGGDDWRERARALAARIGPLAGPDSTDLLRIDRDRDEGR